MQEKLLFFLTCQLSKSHSSLTVRNLDLAARILLYFVNLFTSSAYDFWNNSKDFSWNTLHNVMSMVKENYVHVLTETDHAIRHPELFRHRGGSDTVDKSGKTMKDSVKLYTTNKKWPKVLEYRIDQQCPYLCWDRAAS